MRIKVKKCEYMIKSQEMRQKKGRVHQECHPDGRQDDPRVVWYRWEVVNIQPRVDHDKRVEHLPWTDRLRSSEQGNAHWTLGNKETYNINIKFGSWKLESDTLGVQNGHYLKLR